MAIGTGLYHETSKVAQEKLKEYLSVSAFHSEQLFRTSKSWLSLQTCLWMTQEGSSGGSRTGFNSSTTDADETYNLKRRNSRTRLSTASSPSRDGQGEDIPLQEFK
jgi:hypothetical protein